MSWKPIVGKLLLVGAASGGLALAVFVWLPRLTETQAPAEPPVAEEIVADVRSVPDTDDRVEEGGMPVPSPLVAVRDNGEEIAVLFPAADGERTPEETLGAGDGPAEEEPQAVQGPTAEGLPPVLSPEEVAAAMASLEDTTEDSGEPVVAAETMPEHATEADEPSEVGASAAKVERRGLEGAPVTDSGGARHAELTLPPPSATRDVQELLEALGYGPGPVDGIWGKRTARAWRSFARDAAGVAAGTEPAPLQPEDSAGPAATESPTPSGVNVEPKGPGAGQAGDSRHPAGLPPQETLPPVVVPGTLRGVMGYRMPLVSRQGVPDQVVSGVLIPAHTTFVVLKPGHWELVGLGPREVERLRDAASRESVMETKANAQPEKRGWNPLRLFRKRSAAEGEK